MTINITSEKIMKIGHTVLLVVILGLLLWSQPWSRATTNGTTRTITVSGEATLEATPDEYVFYPYFEEKGNDQEALKESLNTKANAAVEKIKDIGVPEDKIKLDASSYDRWYWRENEEGVLAVNLTITVTDKDTAQEVQDYLLTLDTKGQLTPQASFSKDRQKELDAEAVEKASSDARSKAEAQAALFGAKLGKVVKVDQGSDSVFPTYMRGVAESTDDVALEQSASLPVLPGQNEYSQTVNVTYELK